MQSALTIRSPREVAASATTTVEAVVAKAALFGVAGWAAENVLFGPFYSSVWQGRRVPFLPIYALGGVTVLAVAPHLKRWPVLGRAAAYAVLLGGLEYLGCQADRKIFNGVTFRGPERTLALSDGPSRGSWDYGSDDIVAKAADGCVDLKHAALWGVLGLLAEKMA